MLQFGKIAIVGAGNVAYTLCKVLKNKEIKPYCVYVRDAAKAEKMRQDLGVETVLDYEKVLNSDFLIIAVRDDEIAEVASHIVDYKGLAVHTSGAKSSEVLNRIERYGVLYTPFTMSKEREVSFDNVPLLIYANSPEDLIRLNGFAEQLSSKVEYCDDEQRKVIHLAAVFVSNFTNLMLGIGDKIMKDNGLSLDLMHPLVKEMIQKSFEISPDNALTGPARRGDLETIHNHEEMLANHPKELEIYRVLTNYILEKYHNNEKL